MKFGKLSAVLDIIKKYNLNLSKIQSLILMIQMHIHFILDIEFESKDTYERCIEDLRKETVKLKVLGVYRGEVYKPKINEPQLN